ncbi:unnamed protein product [Sphagnum troendelagicum]|uniref:Dynein regulatory complex subunit 3 n=1 Tax=Sphagnum troendelagicum TaxID=128251 RepID=A0ABP0U876_9BRYO
MEGKAITTNVLRSSILIEGTSGEGLEERRKSLPLKVVTWLQFSFRGIKQIDYLVGFESLTRLQLDNNNLTMIEKLDHLITLTELDLSFNHITKIEGVSKLTRLVDLSFYNNKLTTIEGLDTLEDLASLSLGNNEIKDLDKVFYLRQFRNLRLLCLEGNPLCKDPEYKLYTIAYMRVLLYLDHHLVFANLLKQAREQYQDALQELKDKEKKEEIAWKERNLKEVEKVLFEKANLLGIDDFLDMMLKTDVEHQKLAVVPNLMIEALAEYKERFLIVAEEVKSAIVAIHNTREQEKMLHKLAVEGVLKRRDNEGRVLCRVLHKKKKQIFEECLQDRTTAELKLNELLDDCTQLQEKLFEIEGETYCELNLLWNEFEENFFTTIDAAKGNFANLYPFFFGHFFYPSSLWQVFKN